MSIAAAEGKKRARRETGLSLAPLGTPPNREDEEKGWVEILFLQFAVELHHTLRQHLEARNSQRTPLTEDAIKLRE